MATPNKTSSTTGALWAIALSLAVIAACLVVLVTRQERPSEAERADGTKVTAQPTKPADERRLPKSFVVSPAQPTIAAPPGPEPIVSSGLAPLTYLATNSPDSKSPASIRGRVTLQGTPPPENPIAALTDNPQCGPLHHGPITTHFFQVSKDGGLADVFVYISRGLSGQKFSAPNAPVVLNQKGCF